MGGIRYSSRGKCLTREQVRKFVVRSWRGRRKYGEQRRPAGERQYSDQQQRAEWFPRDTPEQRIEAVKGPGSQFRQGQRKQRELQRMDADLREDVQRDRERVLRASGQKMSDVIRKLADQRGYDLVVDISNTYYFKPAMDLTKDATAAYDQAYPVKP